jgi:uncharacterized delta-60 repeat protein
MSVLFRFFFLSSLFLLVEAAFAQSGSVDTSFDPMESVYSSWGGSIHRIAIQKDGKILIAGQFSKYNNTKARHLARLNSDGSLDTSLKLGRFNWGGGIYNFAIQDDGKIIVAGGFTKYNGIEARGMVRLHSNGDLDTTFFVGKGANDAVGVILIQKDGKILIEGDFRKVNGYRTCGLVRLLPNGSIDSSFIGRAQCKLEHSGIFDMVLQEDGKLIIVGHFHEYNNVGRKNIARLKSDGSLDHSFLVDPNTNGWIESVAIQKDGKILVAGIFTKLGGEKARYLARLDTNGRIDSSFQIGFGPKSSLFEVAIQDDGKIIIAGFFKKYNNIPVQRIARIHIDGSLDTSFNNNNAEIDHWITRVVLQKDGKIIAIGPFTFFHSYYRKRIVRLHK